MTNKSEGAPVQLSAQIYLIIMISSVASTLFFLALILVFIPLEPWLRYALIGALVLSEMFVVTIVYSQYTKLKKPSAHGMASSGFGERRADIGSKAPSKRH